MSTRTLLAAAALAALLPLAAQADSGTDVIARSSASGNGPGGFSVYSWNYYVANGFYGGGQSATSTGSASGTATSSTAQAHDTGADAFGNYAGSSTANANLANATVSATATNSGYVQNHGGGTGHPYAQIYDTLTFDAAGATASTVSTFDVTFTIHSDVSIDPGTDTRDGNGYTFSTVALGGHDARGEVYYDSDTYAVTGSGAIKTRTDTYPSAWDGTWVVSPDDKTLTYTGAISFTGTSWTGAFREDTELDCEDGIQCTDDASVAFSLPTGVTMSSESGAFLTAGSPSAVPEPQNALLLLAGLGALAMATRRRAGVVRG